MPMYSFTNRYNEFFINIFFQQLQQMSVSSAILFQSVKYSKNQFIYPYSISINNFLDYSLSSLPKIKLNSKCHFLAAACVLVENEVFIRKISYTQDNLPDRIPAGAETSHGYSFVMSWISFVAYVIAGAVFLFTSHKRKADMADEFDECVEEDDPVVIRR